MRDLLPSPHYSPLPPKAFRPLAGVLHLWNRSVCTLPISSFLAALSSLLALSSCATLYDATVGVVTGDTYETGSDSSAQTDSSTDAKASTSEVVVKPRDGSRRTRLEGVEISWEIPREETDGFIITYRIGKNSENKKISISSSEVERFEDPQLGFLYRYVIPDVPADQPLYATISSYRGSLISPPSEMISALPTKGEQ